MHGYFKHVLCNTGQIFAFNDHLSEILSVAKYKGTDNNKGSTRRYLNYVVPRSRGENRALTSGL